MGLKLNILIATVITCIILFITGHAQKFMIYIVNNYETPTEIATFIRSQEWYKSPQDSVEEAAMSAQAPEQLSSDTPSQSPEQESLDSVVAPSQSVPIDIVPFKNTASLPVPAPIPVILPSSTTDLQERCRVIKQIPVHWSDPPKQQTKEMIPLPDGYGCGSSAKKSWILKNQEDDMYDPWITYDNSNWNGEMKGQKWVIKRLWESQAMNFNGSVKRFGNAQFFPFKECTEEEKIHLQQKKYNLIFVQWIHKAGGAFIVYYQRGETKNDDLTPIIVQRNNEGFFVQSTQREDFKVGDKDTVNLVIYNNGENTYIMTNTSSTKKWDVRTVPNGNYWGAQKMYRDTSLQVKIVWFGSNSEEFIKDDMVAYIQNLPSLQFD